MREKFRDKSRDNLNIHLKIIGINSELAERGRAEEGIGNSWHKKSLGIIDIPDGPFRYINIVKRERSKDSPPRWWYNFIIPDSGEKDLRKSGAVDVKSQRKKSFPIFGKVISVSWKSNDVGKILSKALSNDPEFGNLAYEVGNIRIRTLPENFFPGWYIEIDRHVLPTDFQWAKLTKIAELCMQ